MASLKKHLQNLHPDIYEKLDSDHNLEEFCNVIKSEADPDAVSNKSSAEHKKGHNGTSKGKDKEKEETKRQILVPQPAVPKNHKEEPAVVAAAQVPVAAAEVPPGAGLSMTPIIGPYYAPVQPDMFSLAYGNPFLYGQQNYGLLCMLQAAKQNESMRQSDFWMQKLASTPPLPILAHPSPMQPSSAESVPVSAPQPVSYTPTTKPEIKCPEPQVEPKIEPPPVMDQQSDTNAALLARIASLPTDPVKPMPQSEHHHIHCEFCGHCTIRHNGHIDFVHDAELHYVSPSGIILFCGAWHELRFRRGVSA